MTQMQWQPIETAPRDGTQVLACFDLNYVPFTAYWNEAYGWTTCGDEFDCFPTHWQPLPPPPPITETARREP